MGIGLALSGCSDVTNAPPVGSPLHVEDAYMLPVLPGEKDGIVYMKLRNSSRRPLHLVSVESDVSPTVWMMGRVPDLGVGQMHTGYFIAAGATLELKPNQARLELKGVDRSLNVGDTVQLQFKVRGQSDAVIEVPVRAD